MFYKSRTNRKDFPARWIRLPGLIVHWEKPARTQAELEQSGRQALTTLGTTSPDDGSSAAG